MTVAIGAFLTQVSAAAFVIESEVSKLTTKGVAPGNQDLLICVLPALQFPTRREASACSLQLVVDVDESSARFVDVLPRCLVPSLNVAEL